MTRITARYDIESQDGRTTAVPLLTARPLAGLGLRPPTLDHDVLQIAVELEGVSMKLASPLLFSLILTLVVAGNAQTPGSGCDLQDEVRDVPRS